VTENKAVKELEETLRDLLNAHIDNEGITLAELIGILEVIKWSFISNNLEDDED